MIEPYPIQAKAVAKLAGADIVNAPTGWIERAGALVPIVKENPTCL